MRMNYNYKPEVVDFYSWSFWRRIKCSGSMERYNGLLVSDVNVIDTGYCLDRYTTYGN